MTTVHGIRLWEWRAAKICRTYSAGASIITDRPVRHQTVTSSSARQKLNRGSSNKAIGDGAVSIGRVGTTIPTLPRVKYHSLRLYFWAFTRLSEQVQSAGILVRLQHNDRRSHGASSQVHTDAATVAVSDDRRRGRRSTEAVAVYRERSKK